MRSVIRCFAFLLVVMYIYSPAQSLAGPYSDAVTKCLVEKTSKHDRERLAQWFFVAMASHPSAQPLSAVSESDRAEVSQRAAELFERLLTESCRKETQDAIKYEGQQTINSAFSALGEIAARELMAHPDATAFVSRLSEYLDEDKLNAVLQNP